MDIRNGGTQVTEKCSILEPDKNLYNQISIPGVIEDGIAYALVDGEKFTIGEYVKNILARQLDYDGPWIIEVNHGYGYINHENGEVILRDLYSACYFHEGKALVQKSEGNYFTVDDRGNFIERHEYLRHCYLKVYSSAHFRACYRPAILKGDVIFLPYEKSDEPPAKGAFFRELKDDERRKGIQEFIIKGARTALRDCGYVDCETGHVISSGWFDTEPFYQGKAVVISKDRQFRVIDTEGNIVEKWENIKPCDILREIGEVTMRGLIDGEFVYVLHENGRMSLSDYFIEEHMFGAAAFCVKGKWGHALVKTGKIVSEPQWDLLGHCYYEDGIIVKRDGKYGFTDHKGNMIVEPIYEDSHRSFRGGFVPVKRNGKWGLINQYGKEVIPFEWDDALEFSYDGRLMPNPDNWDSQWLPFAFLRKEKCGFVSQNGELIVKSKEPFLIGTRTRILTLEEYPREGLNDDGGGVFCLSIFRQD
jgi:hypothetical protein